MNELTPRWPARVTAVALVLGLTPGCVGMGSPLGSPIPSTPLVAGAVLVLGAGALACRALARLYGGIPHWGRP